MKYKKLLYSTMILASLGGALLTASGVLANGVSISTGTSKTSIAQAAVKIGDWITDKSTAGVIKITGYTGDAKDVVVPTAKDFGDESKEVRITKAALNAAATKANTHSGTVSFSTNGGKVIADGKDWDSAFSDLSSLTSIDLKNFDTSNVTDMSGMFWFCGGLTRLDLSGFKTENVTNMTNMFNSCNGLTHLDLSGFKTENVTNMSNMFNACDSLTNLDLSGFKTENVTDMSNMFNACRGLTRLDLSGFKTESVTDMSGMFATCNSLTRLDLSGFKTENVTTMSGMFWYCEELTNLDLSGFKTENVTDMSNMFYGCDGLKTLDLSHFNMSKVTKFSAMFYADTKKALTIYTTEPKLQPDAYDYKSNNIDPVTVENAPVVQHTVTFKAETGGSLTGSTTEKVDQGDKVSHVPTVKANSGYDFSGWYEGTKKVDPKTVVINGDTTFTAKFTKHIEPPTPEVNFKTIYRLYNKNTGEHFYTESAFERASLIKNGWNDEGKGWSAPTSGTPVYRVYNSNVKGGDHYYTASHYEAESLVRIGWRWDNGGRPTFYSGGKTPIYVAYNPNAYTGSHNYTSSLYEQNSLLNKGWKYGQVQFYGK